MFQPQIVVGFAPLMQGTRAALQIFLEVEPGNLVYPGSKKAMKVDPLLSRTGEELQKLLAEPDNIKRFEALRKEWLENVGV